MFNSHAILFIFLDVRRMNGEEGGAGDNEDHIEKTEEIIDEQEAHTVEDGSGDNHLTEEDELNELEELLHQATERNQNKLNLRYGHVL